MFDTISITSDQIMSIIWNLMFILYGLAYIIPKDSKFVYFMTITFANTLNVVIYYMNDGKIAFVSIVIAIIAAILTILQSIKDCRHKTNAITLTLTQADYLISMYSMAGCPEDAILMAIGQNTLPDVLVSPVQANNEKHTLTKDQLKNILVCLLEIFHRKQKDLLKLNPNDAQLINAETRSFNLMYEILYKECSLNSN